MGWPERVGGLGGSNLLRAYLGEVLTARDFVEPGIYSMPEVLAPTMIDYAPADLAAQMVPRLLRGEETWCQGFSEPGTGSNLASLACRATRTDEGWRVNGQKVWTSLAQYAQRCVLLTRTGTPESAHRGITALFVDMDSPGITVRPIETHARRPGVLRGLLRRRPRAARPGPRRGRPRLVHRHGPAPLRAQHGAVAPGRLPAAPAAAAGVDRPGRCPRPLRRGRRRPSSYGRSGPVRGRPSAGSRPARRSAPRPPSTRCSWRRPSRRCSTSSSRASAPRWRSGTTRRAAMARRVPLLAGRHHLRRQRRDPAQHHRPPPPRPGSRPLMETAERAALRRRASRAPSRRAARARSTRRSTTSVGTTRWRPTGAPRSPCSSKARGRPT